MASVAAISQQIWDMKYRLKSAAGAPVDKSIDDSWRRVADTLARPEKERQYWAERFYEALQGFEFLPAGRIIAGAGAARKVTLFNCFVMGTIPDDMSGIFQHLKEAALTMQQGGGIGYDFSTLRPKGAPVKGVGADASGPLSFMDVWDSMCRTIMSAGARRGAMMATMRCDHPDIEAFIEAKHEPGRLRMFNLSVLVGDAFMEAVRDNQPWDLVFDGVCWKTLPARELWEKIMRATYAYAEPGVIFIDRINRLNNLNYCEEIHSCNPCVTRDAWVPTAMGPRQVGELLGRPFTALVDGHKWPSGKAGFFATGRKTVVRLKTREGYSLRLTPDHPIRRVAVKTRWRKESEWTRAGDLRPGDEVILNDHREAGNWSGPLTEDEGHLIGPFVVDGTLKSARAVLICWSGATATQVGRHAGVRPEVAGMHIDVRAFQEHFPGVGALEPDDGAAVAHIGDRVVDAIQSLGETCARLAVVRHCHHRQPLVGTQPQQGAPALAMCRFRRNGQLQTQRPGDAGAEIGIRCVAADHELRAGLALAQKDTGIRPGHGHAGFDAQGRQSALPLVALRHSFSLRPGRRNAAP